MLQEAPTYMCSVSSVPDYAVAAADGTSGVHRRSARKAIDQRVHVQDACVVAPDFSLEPELLRRAGRQPARVPSFSSARESANP